MSPDLVFVVPRPGKAKRLCEKDRSVGLFVCVAVLFVFLVCESLVLVVAGLIRSCSLVFCWSRACQETGILVAY